MTIDSFRALGLGEQLEQTLAQLGLNTPTPIQLAAIPALLDGRDLIASAPTGTGKTAAFLLPALSRLAGSARGPKRAPRVLVLTPTRELAQQVAKSAVSFSAGMPTCRTVCITGGESYREQDRLLSAHVDVMVATPGRLLDQWNGRRIDLSRVEMFVLDEADRMLDMGFSEDVLTIARALPAARQTVCFTATLSRTVRELAAQLLKDPEIVQVAEQQNRHDAIDQHVVFVDDAAHKRRLLEHWLGAQGTGQAIIFTATKRDAEALAQALSDDGHASVVLHGDLQQRERTRMLTRLRRGEARVLVATDVAARGIDVPAITHVFNYDLPRTAEDYVHRIGRTGRAGASGVAVSFVGRADMGGLKRIEHFLRRKVRVTAIEGLEGRYRPAERTRQQRPHPGGGARPWAAAGGRRQEGLGSAERHRRNPGEARVQAPGVREAERGSQYGWREGGVAVNAGDRHDGTRPVVRQAAGAWRRGR